MSNQKSILLDVRNLQTQFAAERGVARVVDEVSFTLAPGEVLGIVGESGSGKSMTALSVMGLVPSPGGRVVGGEVWFGGRDLLKLDPNKLRDVRGKEIGMIFQDPMTSLNPALTIGRQLREGMRRHLGVNKADAHRRAIELLDLVGIPEATGRMGDYPHQFSGGMRQRVMIAMALSCKPQLLIADEPTTALDVTIQAQILDLLRAVREEFHMAMILITHDMGVIAGIADYVNVMYAGRIVESGAVGEVLDHARHPYTVGLLACVPRIDMGERQKLNPIPGLPPNVAALPPGCAFQDRCPHVITRCRSDRPELDVPHGESGDRRTACWVDPLMSISGVRQAS